MKKLACCALVALLAGCHKPAPVDVIAAAEAQAAQAAQVSAHAARLDSSAAQYYAQGRAAEDSATFYHHQSTHVQATAIYTAALRRFFAGY